MWLEGCGRHIKMMITVQFFISGTNNSEQEGHFGTTRQSWISGTVPKIPGQLEPMHKEERWLWLEERWSRDSGHWKTDAEMVVTGEEMYSGGPQWRDGAGGL